LPDKLLRARDATCKRKAKNIAQRLHRHECMPKAMLSF
jgi:hypothetical protein